jgi:hypothetical protein
LKKNLLARVICLLSEVLDISLLRRCSSEFSL